MRIYIKKLNKEHAEEILALKLKNKKFFEPFEPTREERHFTIDGQLDDLQTVEENRLKDASYSFGIFLRNNDNLIGRINLNAITRGAFQNTYLGYYLDEEYNARGCMTEAVVEVMKVAFKELGLHRIQAAIMLNNNASRKVLMKSGFRKEGVAEKYLKINGKWEDHELYALTSEEFN